MILVTGATGATGGVGRHVVAELLAQGVAVRALVRDPDKADLPSGVEVVLGDLTDPASLDAALADVESVFLLWPFFSADGGAAVVDAIARKSRRVVYLSAQAAAADQTSFWATLERQIAESGLEWTVLRPTGFAKNTLGWADQIRSGVVHGPYGEAARSLIDERDIAAVAVQALTTNGHVGNVYVLSGPATVTQAEQVQIIGAAVGRQVRWREQSPREARPSMMEISATSRLSTVLWMSGRGSYPSPRRSRPRCRRSPVPPHGRSIGGRPITPTLFADSWTHRPGRSLAMHGDPDDHQGDAENLGQGRDLGQHDDADDGRRSREQ